MRFLSTLNGALVFGVIGAIIGALALLDSSVALPGLGLIIAGWLFGATTGFIVGAIVGAIVGLILGSKNRQIRLK